MAKIYINKINRLLRDGELVMTEVDAYISENVPSRWQSEVRAYFLNV